MLCYRHTFTVAGAGGSSYGMMPAVWSLVVGWICGTWFAHQIMCKCWCERERAASLGTVGVTRTQAAGGTFCCSPNECLPPLE